MFSNKDDLFCQQIYGNLIWYLTLYLLHIPYNICHWESHSYNSLVHVLYIVFMMVWNQVHVPILLCMRSTVDSAPWGLPNTIKKRALEDQESFNFLFTHISTQFVVLNVLFSLVRETTCVKKLWSMFVIDLEVLWLLLKYDLEVLW